MIKLSLIVIAVLLAGCSSTQRSSPNEEREFKTGEVVRTPYGCELLRKQIEEQNKNTGRTDKADC